MNIESGSDLPVRRHRWITLLSALILCLTLGANPPAPVAQEIEQIMEAPSVSSAMWGIHVQDVRTGEVLYSHNAGKAFIPASNQKLLTSAAALDALGPDYRYKTRLLFDGRVDGSVMRGDLILVGSGDPTLGSIEMGGEDPLSKWANALAEIGVTRFEGRIIGDDDVFDDRPYAEGWDIDYIATQSSRSLGVAAGGLSYNDNVVEVQIESGGVGDPPNIRMRPAAYLDIENHATTAARRRGWAIDLNRVFGTETIELSGTIPRSYRGTVVMPVTNPTMLTLHVFARELQQAGIEVAGDMVDIDALEETPDYEEAELLFVHFSPPLSEILEVLNKESNNFYAEQVFRTMAYGGSANGGERRVEDLLAKAGLADPNLSIRDGSGLSRKNLISPRAMVALLTYMNEHPARAAFHQSLASGGEARTTLRGRLGGVPVHAKTGSLEYVRSLSGYTETADGRPVAFAVFANNFTGPSYLITQTIDQIVRAVSSSSAG